MADFLIINEHLKEEELMLKSISTQILKNFSIKELKISIDLRLNISNPSLN